MKIALRLFLFFVTFQFPIWAADLSPAWYSKNTQNAVVIHVELYLSSSCPHCQHADEFFKNIEPETPYLQVQRYFINQDKNALFRFNQLLSEQQQNDFSVPSTYICNSRWVGFASAETTGKDLLHAIKYCKQQIEKSGQLTQATVNTLRHLANANRFNTGEITEPSRFHYTVSVALLDSFNPCALFCFTGFLAFLLIEDRRKKQIVASLLFIVAVGIVHYVQQVHTSLFFQIVQWLRIPSVILGLLTVYFVIQHNKKQSNDFLYYLLAFLLGLITITYQQTCIMSWSTIFEQWLINQQISNAQANVYQLVYQIIYLVPLILILFIFILMFKMKRFIALRKKLTKIGLLFLLVIALCLLIYPYILSYFAISAFTLIILVVCGYFIQQF